MQDKHSDIASPMVTNAECILVDIEGTTSAIQFVYDVLFPYARGELSAYLKKNWRSRDVQDAIVNLAKDKGFTDLAQWSKTATEEEEEDVRGEVDQNSVGDSDKANDELLELQHQDLVEKEIIRLMDADIKSTGLKTLQGLIWAEGYDAGKLTSHVYPDVPEAFRRWKDSGVDIRIFSSGSVNAQKVFFANTEYGDLSKFVSANYDTTSGAKRDPESYKAIAAQTGLNPKQILFLSDVEQELSAAKKSGMQVALVVRPGNAPADREKFPVIQSFGQVSIRR